MRRKLKGLKIRLKQIQLIFIIFIIILSYFSPLIVHSTKLKLSLVYFDEWVPGNAFGNPVFVDVGNFTGNTFDEILLISDVPDKSDVITLCKYNNEELEVLGSKDRDFSAVYNQFVADFDGNGDYELFISEDLRDFTNEHVGSQHFLFDFASYSFEKITSISYTNPNIIIDYACIGELNEQIGIELVLSTFDQNNLSELIRLYTYVNDHFSLINYTSLELTDTINFRSVIFSGIGNFDIDPLNEIIIISKSSLISNPSNFFIDYNIYEYNQTSEQIILQNSNLLYIENSNINFCIGDMNSDTIDELIIYYDRVTAPTLQIYNLSAYNPEIIYSNSRSYANYLDEGWICNGIFLQDFTNDFHPEILISEAIISSNDLRGRYEIYEIVDNSLISKLMVDIEQPPISVCIGNIDSYNDIEIISVFNNYNTENFPAKGGIEIWSTGKWGLALGNFPYLLFFSSVFIFFWIRKKK